MNWLELTPLGDALAWTILHTFWQFALIYLLLNVVLLAIPLSKPNTRYGLLLLGMAVALVLSIGTFIQVFDQQTLLPEVGYVNSQMVNLSNEGLGNISNDAPFMDNFGLVLLKLEFYLPYILLGWLGGILLTLCYFLLGFVKLRTLRTKGLQQVDQIWLEKFQHLKQRMGVNKNVALYISEQVNGPLTFQYFKPIVLVPLGFFSGLNPSHVELLLLHELAHIKRSDYLVNIVQSLLETLFFYHPAIWWISKKIREEREHCCDNLVLTLDNDPHAYADALTKVQPIFFTIQKPLSMSASPKKGLLTKRVFRIFAKHDAQPSIYKGLIFILLLIAFVPAQTYLLFANPIEKPDPIATIETIPMDTLPLYVIDGKILEQSEGNKDQRKEINELVRPKDIQSIKVLKEGAAKEKYGEQGMNGVIEITTKKEKPVSSPVKKPIKKSQQSNLKVIENKPLKIENNLSDSTLMVLESIANQAEPSWRVQGMVFNESQRPLIGATLLVKDSKIGTITDLAGKFVLDLPSPCETLVISYYGYKKQEVKFCAHDNRRISLTKSEAEIDSEREFKQGFNVKAKESEFTTALKAFPNPSSGEIQIEFKLNKPVPIKLNVFGADGKNIANIFDGQGLAGVHQYSWKPNAAQKGVFIISLEKEGKNNFLTRVEIQ